jgi:hypothetical protein
VVKRRRELISHRNRDSSDSHTTNQCGGAAYHRREAIGAAVASEAQQQLGAVPLQQISVGVQRTIAAKASERPLPPKHSSSLVPCLCAAVRAAASSA